MIMGKTLSQFLSAIRVRRNNKNDSAFIKLAQVPFNFFWLSHKKINPIIFQFLSWTWTYLRLGSPLFYFTIRFIFLIQFPEIKMWLRAYFLEIRLSRLEIDYISSKFPSLPKRISLATTSSNTSHMKTPQAV